jgi:hypothetical protein
MVFVTGAGHPGEEDVPGLVLVCSTSTVFMGLKTCGLISHSWLVRHKS